jgi:protein involved in polysaccharide export with SLBB domain
MQFPQWFRITGGVLFATGALVASAGAQTAGVGDPGPVRMSRQQLQELLDSHQQSAGSSAYSTVLRTRAHSEAELIRQRLEEGDFQVGDRIELSVEGEDSLSNTFTVTDQRTILLHAVGHVPLNGVLRSELEDHLTKQLARFIRNPKVSAQSRIRVTVVGGVEKPGFYVVAPEALITDILMEAGGVTADAILTELEITRRERQVISPEALTVAIQQGRTLDQLNMRAGDVINVAEHGKKRSFFGVFTVAASTALTLLLLATQIR